MHYLRSIVFAATLAGIVAGGAVSAIQLFGTSPLILKAEVYEKSEPTVQSNLSTQPSVDVHDHSDMSAHEHGDSAWEPEDGAERIAFTVVANILTAIGYSLVLTALISLRGKPVTAREGILWGLAGFASVMLAPMLGLPPELPGMPAGPLEARQLWWFGTAIATAAGVGLASFQRKPWAVLLAIVLIMAPHIVGAPPAPAEGHALAPESLERQFVFAAVLTSLAFWLMVGPLSGVFLRRFQAND